MKITGFCHAICILILIVGLGVTMVSLLFSMFIHISDGCELYTCVVKMSDKCEKCCIIHQNLTTDNRAIYNTCYFTKCPFGSNGVYDCMARMGDCVGSDATSCYNTAVIVSFSSLILFSLILFIMSSIYLYYLCVAIDRNQIYERLIATQKEDDFL